MSQLQLHEYQERAIKFSLTHQTVYLAIDMGLGKTAIALKAIEESGQKAFVFAPLQAMLNTWPEEIAKWTPNLSYDILHGPTKNEVLRSSKADILLMNYDGLKWFAKALAGKGITWTKRAVVFDEASMIKSSTTLRFKTLKKAFPLWTDLKLALSATPAPNGYADLWSQYFLLDKGARLFSSFYRYRGHYFIYTGPPLYKTIPRTGSDKRIQAKIQDITFRLDAKDYLKMPEYISNEIPIEMPKKLQAKYKELEENFFLEFEAGEATAFSAAALSMKLRQFIQGAMYLDVDPTKPKGPRAFEVIHQQKVEALKALLETSAGHPILCAIQFKFELAMINQALKKQFKNGVPVIAGGVPTKITKQHMKNWNSGNLPLLLCHPASLGHGVNLQAGGHIILWFGLSWNLEHYTQLNGRIYRQGQKQAVISNHLVMKGSIDERIIKVLRQKGATQQQLLDALKRG